MNGPQVVKVDRVNGDVVVSFEDGLVVLYPAALLRQMLPQAEILPDVEDEAEE